MMYLMPIDFSEKSLRIWYQFRTEINPNWKKYYIQACLFQNKTPISQGDMDDYTYFKTIEIEDKASNPYDTNDYLLIDNNKPVCAINTLRNGYIICLSCITNPKYQNKGYAKTATTMIENIVFANKDIIFTSIKDMSKNGATTHIALSLGYTYDSRTNTFCKVNPNLTEEEILNKYKNLGK